MRNSRLSHSVTNIVFNVGRTHVVAGVIAASAMICGCASAPIPTEQFAVSQAAIERANAAGAAEYAPLQLQSAREKLASAQHASDNKEYPAAAALAEEATVDAKLAETKSESEKAKRSVAELQNNLRTLQEESVRNNQLNEQTEQNRNR